MGPAGVDEVKGQYISYDSLTEKYLVTNGRGDSKSAVGTEQARVRAIIQPKNKNAPAPDKAESVTLRPSVNLRQ